MTTTPTTTPARAARRQNLLNRWTERLTERGVAYAADLARVLLDDMDEAGFRLPAALEDAAPLAANPAPEDSPGRRAFAEARAALTAKRTRTDTSTSQVDS
jgi:hypothetical protein